MQGGIPPAILKNLALTSTSASFIEIWQDDMANYTNIVQCTIPDVQDLEIRKPLALLILWTYGRLCICASAIYIAFKGTLMQI